MLLRMKEDYDGAEPSANSVSALNLFRLSAMLGRKDFAEAGEKILKAQGGQIERAPHAVPQLLAALAWKLSPAWQVVLAGDPKSGDLAALRQCVVRAFLPNGVLLYADGGQGQAWLGGRVEFFKEAGLLDGKAAAYACRNFTCQLPVNEPKKLEEILEKALAPAGSTFESSS